MPQEYRTRLQAAARLSASQQRAAVAVAGFPAATQLKQVKFLKTIRLLHRSVAAGGGIWQAG
jgi:hypothetical protein